MTGNAGDLLLLAVSILSRRHRMWIPPAVTGKTGRRRLTISRRPPVMHAGIKACGNIGMAIAAGRIVLNWRHL